MSRLRIVGTSQMYQRSLGWLAAGAGLLVAVVLVFVLGLQNRSLRAEYAALYRRAGEPHAGMYVPTFRAVTLNGEPVTVGDVTSGGRQVLFVFTTTCPYCLGGFDYPLFPGQAVIIATDAVDHRIVNPAAEDLSRANFEFIGPADVDNPSVPNMVNVGLREKGLGHGWFYSSIDGHPFVAQALDVGSLPRAQVCFLACRPVVRVPKAAVLDIAVFMWPGSDIPACPHQVHNSLDRQPGFFLPTADFDPHSIQRKVFRTLPNGRRILLRTKTTSRDFEVRFPRTPKSVP